MKLYFTFLLYLLLVSLNTHAQPGNNIWTFGTGGGLDFSSGTPVAATNSMNSEAACASVSSYSGALLFYSNGEQVWDRNHNLMPNGSGLSGNPAAATAGQGVLIVPFINDTTKYYLFSMNTTLYYSVVDMTLNSGLGDIVPGQKNIQLAAGLGSELAAAQGNNCSVWVLTHKAGLHHFLAYKIIGAGINTTPVISVTGSFLGNNAYETGMLKVSPSGKRLAISNFTSSVSSPPNPAFSLPSFIEVFDFNANTGMVSNPLLVDTLFEHFYNFLGVCFSPDGSKIYTTNPFLPLMPVNGAGVYQYDISLGNTAAIMASKTAVGNTPLCSDLQLGPDHKIYVTPGWGMPAGALDCINNPDVAGTGCNYSAAAVSLLTGTAAKGMLPSAVVYPNKDTLRQSFNRTVCAGQQLQLHAPAGYFRYFFEGNRIQALTQSVSAAGTYYMAYEDDCSYHVDTYHVANYVLASGLLDTALCGTDFAIVYDASTLNPPATQYLWNDGTTGSVYTAQTEGVYWVKMNLDECSNTDTIRVRSKPIPDFNLGRDTILCYGEALELEAPAHADAYAWPDGSTGRHFEVKQAGTYFAQVTLDDCKGADTIKIGMEDCNCRPFVPNAFSPNGDGLNDVFNPFFKCGNLDIQFHISIFNRWGQRLFYSTSMNNGWDGTFNGQPVEVGTYFYDIQYSTQLSTGEKKGDIVVVR